MENEIFKEIIINGENSGYLISNRRGVKRSVVASIHYKRPQFKYIWKDYFEE